MPSIICRQCGKSFYVPPRRSETVIACSNTCRGLLQRSTERFDDTELTRRLEENSIPVPFAGCRLWLGSLTRGGYGVVYVGGPPRGNQQLAHRVSYQLRYGPIPDGLEPDHLCRVRCCIEPIHMEAVTRTENIRRGIGPSLTIERHRAKTHCVNGHPFDADNTAIRQGRRSCRECERIHSRLFQQNKRARLRAQREAAL